MIAFFDHRKACRQLAELSSTAMHADLIYHAIYVDDRGDFVAVGRELGMAGIVLHARA